MLLQVQSKFLLDNFENERKKSKSKKPAEFWKYFKIPQNITTIKLKIEIKIKLKDEAFIAHEVKRKFCVVCKIKKDRT